MRAAVLGTGVIAALSFGVGLLTDFGEKIDGTFFEVVASGVLPLLLVTAILEIEGLAKDVQEGRVTEIWFSSVALTYGAMFVFGEGSALYAVADDNQTTFVFLATSLCTLLFTFEVIGVAHRRIAGAREVEDVAGEKIARRFRRRLGRRKG